MGFINTDKKRTDPRVFLDREDILDLIEKNVCIYNEQTAFFKLFAFYGMGGIGKSQLIRKIYRTYSGSNLSLYYYPLEILNQETIPSILLSIRQEFDYTPHFDYALFRYWDFISYDRVDRENLYSISHKIFTRLGKIFDATIGLGLIDTGQLVREAIILYEEKVITEEEEQLVSEILQDKIEDLYTYLVEKLAADIQKELGGLKYMFLFDAYDLGKSNYKFDWLKLFINSFQNGLFFVTSREELDWFNNSNIDTCVIENRSLECIPKDEVQKYLLKQNYTQEQICLIIEKTDCIPLYLDLAIAMDKQTLFLPNMMIGFDSKEDLVKNLLSHLDLEEQLIIQYLSVVNIFNEIIYDYAVKFNNFSLQNNSFSDFKKSTIVRYVEQFNDLYKIHSVLANNISFFVEASIRTQIIDNYLTVIHARILPDEKLYDDIKYNLIVNIYHLIETENLSISESQSEKLIDLFFYLADRSYSNDFYNYIHSIKNKKKSNLFYIYEYIRGKTTRSSDIVVGLQRLQNIPYSGCNFGKHRKSLICDINYLLSISGKYSEAEKRMNAFVTTLTNDETKERYYIKGMIYYCDMQMLRGNFKTAAIDLTLLSDNVSNEKLFYEIQKAIGHCYRFNFMFDDAINYYSKTNASPHNMAYYLTVCCETYCYYKPEKVFDFFENAIVENEKYNNHNNLGKIYYSIAIAMLISHKTYQAKKYLQMAHSEFKSTKYSAGTFFTMIAEAYFEYSETRNVSSETIIKMKKQLRKIDFIYEYLLLPFYVMKGNHEKIEEFRLKYEWFSFDTTLKNIKSFLALL